MARNLIRDELGLTPEQPKVTAQLPTGGDVSAPNADAEGSALFGMLDGTRTDGAGNAEGSSVPARWPVTPCKRE